MYYSDNIFFIINYKYKVFEFRILTKFVKFRKILNYFIFLGDRMVIK